jgi:hypothetical protein
MRMRIIFYTIYEQSDGCGAFTVLTLEDIISKKKKNFFDLTDNDTTTDV